ITWSKNLFLTQGVAKKLAEQGISAEIVDLRTLRPLDKETLLASVAKTHRAVIIQEQHEIASYGTYLAHLIQSEIFDELDAPVEVVSTLETPMPYSKALEQLILPSEERCIEAVHKVLAGCL
ncbi:MAG: hypothetical protein KDD62_05515, partial [Bdellovibrionales bacterium]|nr:hypothetical protein [Bdellovibrionales bacterium]